MTLPPVARASAPAPRADCSAATTQTQLNACAYEDFLAAQAEMAAQLQQVQERYSPAQRTALRRVQRAWLEFRTQACAFESLAAQGGSAQPMVQWQCAARITRERTAALARLQNCPEGDLGCVRPAPAKPAP